MDPTHSVVLIIPSVLLGALFAFLPIAFTRMNRDRDPFTGK